MNLVLIPTREIAPALGKSLEKIVPPRHDKNFLTPHMELGKSLEKIVPPRHDKNFLTPHMELDAVRQVSSLPGQRACLIATADGETARIERSTGGPTPRARITNVLPCGLMTCPNCARRSRLSKSVEVEALVAKLLRTPREFCGHTAGRSLYLLTLTARHHKAQSLNLVLENVNKAAQKLLSGRKGAHWRTMGLELVCRSLEITYGKNGWHPHLHMIVALTPLPLGDAIPAQHQAADLLDDMAKAWLKLVDAEAGIAFQAEHIDPTDAEGIARYVSGIAKSAAMETMRHDLKRGRSENVGVFEIPGLLARSQRGEEVVLGNNSYNYGDLAKLWRDWEQGVRGVHQVALGRGFSDLRLTAEELAARIADLNTQPADDDWQELRELTKDDLRLLRRYGTAPALKAASMHGRAGIDHALAVYAAQWTADRQWAHDFCNGTEALGPMPPPLVITLD